MRVLLDTNVLATGLVGAPLGYSTEPARIWRSWSDGRFTLLLSEHVLSELRDTLELPWFLAKTTPQSRKLALDELLTTAKMVIAEPIIWGVASHSEDDLVLSAAISGNADFLVTRDKEFRQVGEYGGVKIRTPAEFLIELDAALESE